MTRLMHRPPPCRGDPRPPDRPLRRSMGPSTPPTIDRSRRDRLRDPIGITVRWSLATRTLPLAPYEAIKPRWREVSDGSVKQRNLLPGSPARLTNAIDAIASSLAAHGIVFIRGRSKDRRWAQIDARGYFGSESAEPTGFRDETDLKSGLGVQPMTTR